ncbi:MAG: hypothetical protein PHE88_01380 [Elusimicrobia bacterium]|nr:hypothetical protein [Elusimicrobiota bacterium]
MKKMILVMFAISFIFVSCATNKTSKTIVTPAAPAKSAVAPAPVTTPAVPAPAATPAVTPAPAATPAPATPGK